MPSKDQPEVEVDVVDADDLDINEASPEVEESVDNEPKPGEVVTSNPFGGVATPPTIDSGHYAYIDEEGNVVCKKCHGADSEEPCEVCAPLLQELNDDHDHDANPIDHDEGDDDK